MMAAVLVGQLFAMDKVSVLVKETSGLEISASTPLTVRFINADDLREDSLFHQKYTEFLGISWERAKEIITPQIDNNFVRRVIIFKGDKLVGSYGGGRMPLAMKPYFCDDEAISSSEHNALRGAIEIDNLTKEPLDIIRERLDIIRDLYVGLGSSLAMPPKLVGVVRESNPAMPITLVDNGLHAATIIFSGPLSIDPVAVQNAVALQLIMPAIKVSRDSNITEEGYPSFIISQLPQGTDVNISGLMDTYVVDLPYDVGLAGITPTLITVLRTNDGCIAERLAQIAKRVARYREKL